MPPTPSAAAGPSSVGPEAGAAPAPFTDPELAALPRPRRPWRRLTLASMGLTAAVALWMAARLAGDLSFALGRGDPIGLGYLTDVQISPSLANQWVHARGPLAQTGVTYRRPLEKDTFRAAPVEDNASLWVEVRVPRDVDATRFLPPSSFVGRLIPMSQAGLRYSHVVEAIRETAVAPVPSDAWLLVDGEAPSTTRWVLGLMGLFIGFAAFNLWGLLRLLRPVRDDSTV